MLSFVVYFFTVANNGATYIVDTMPMDSEKSCMAIVKTVNTQPSSAGRRVKAACFAGTK
jgi:hypothetical protein